MNIYSLGEGLFPLDWEFCFLSVDDYKRKLTENHKKNPEYFDFKTGGLQKIFNIIDKRLEFALEEFNNTFDKYGSELRCDPMVVPFPKGDTSSEADFIIILKRDNDGDTIVYSPFALPHLENN